MEKIIGDFEVDGEKVQLIAAQFQQGKGLAIVMQGEDGTPWGRLSVNLPNKANLLKDDRECFVKAHDENEPMVAPVLATGVVRATGRVIDGYPVWRLDDKVVIA